MVYVAFLVKFVKELLHANANVDTPDESIENPLLAASGNGHSRRNGWYGIEVETSKSL